MGVVLWHVNLNNVWQMASQLPWHISLLASLLFSTQIFFATLRWFYILKTYKTPPFQKILEANVISIFVQNLFLGTLGASLVRITLVKKLKFPLTVSTLSFIIDRLVILFALATLTLCTAPFIPNLQSITDDIWSVALGITALSLASVFLLKIFLSKTLETFLKQYRRYLQKFRFFFVPSLLKSFSTTLLSLLSYFIGVYLLTRYLNIDISLKELLALLPTITLITSLPISINGWGVRESAMIVGLSLFNIPTDKAFTLSVLTGILSLVSLLPLALPSLFHLYRRPVQRLKKDANDFTS